MRTFASLAVAVALSLTTVACATSGDEQDEVGSVEDEAALAGKLALWQAGNGGWHFNLKSGNGAILLTSESYTSRTGAINGMLSTLENGVDPAQYTIAPSANNGFVIRLLAGNLETIGSSQVYASKQSAQRGVASAVKATTSYLDRREANTTGARVEVAQGDTGKFRFAVFAKNGQHVLGSESYESEAAAYNGAFAAQAASTYTVKQASSGTYYFTVSAANGEIVGTSQQYTTKASAQTAVTSVKSLLPTITIL